MRPVRSFTTMVVTCLVLLAACGNQRQDTLRATVIGLNAARDGFTAWDATHQKSIVEKATTREEGAAALAAYRAKREPVVVTFEAAYRSLALAATATDDPSLKSALAASAALLESILKLKEGAK